RKRVDTRSVVFNNGTSATLDSENTSNLEDNVLGSSPAAKRTSKLDTDNLRSLQLPRKTGHNVDGISTTNTNSGHTETTSIGSVRISTNQETTRESIVFEDDLMDDTGPWLPETNAILGGGRRQEIVDLYRKQSTAVQSHKTSSLIMYT